MGDRAGYIGIHDNLIMLAGCNSVGSLVGAIPVSVPVRMYIELDINAHTSTHMYTQRNHLVVTHRGFPDAKEKWADRIFILFVILVNGRVAEPWGLLCV